MDSTSFDVIAARYLVGIRNDGTQFRIRLDIGRPYFVRESEWACPVAIEGLGGRLRDISGIDALQALWLAMRLARTLLVAFIEDGGQLFWPEHLDEAISIHEVL